MCALSDTSAVGSLTVSLFLVCCGLAASWLNNVVSSDNKIKAALALPSPSLWLPLEHETL